MKSKKSFQLIWGILIVSVAMIGLLAPNQAAGDTFVNVTIDDFTIPFGTSANPPLLNVDPVPSPPLVLRASQPPPVLPQTNVLGGARVLELQVFASASASGKAYIDGNTDPLLRAWAIGNDPGSDSGGRIVWNGSNSLTDPLGCGLPQPNTVGYCANCTWDKFYSLKLQGVSNDQTTTWHVTLFSPGGSATYSFLQLANTTTNPEILRAQFVPTVGFDFATLCRIDISVDHVDALDTTLTEVTAVLDIPNPPDIHCVSPKLLGFTTADMKQHLILPQGATFAGDLYAELSVTNTALASPTPVVIEDVLPAGMTFQGVVNVVSPVGFNLGPDPAIGSGGTISWTSVSSLGVGETLTFTFKVHLVMNAPGILTNSFRARAVGLDFPADVCQGDVTLQNGGKVPSLNEWSAIILCLLLAASAVWLLRKRRVS